MSETVKTEFLQAIGRKHEKVAALDFTLQKRKMAEVFGWHPEVVEMMEDQYRKFLILNAAARETGLSIEIVPTRLIDEFWHLHIMDTAKYHDDCQAVMGEYLHHYPYFGFVDEADTAAWQEASAKAGAVWREVFGEDLYDDAEGDAYVRDRQFHAEMSAAILAGAGNAAGRCRTACKPVRCK